MTLFDYAESKRLMEAGITKAASYPADDWVSRAREVAVYLAKQHGEVTINDVYRVLPRPEGINPNASGSVMRCKELRMIGVRQSDKVSLHCGIVRVYAPASYE